MKLFAHLLLLIISMAFLDSCTAPSIPVAADFTRLSEVACSDTANRVNLSFEGEDITFPYDKVGLIEVTAAEDVSTEKILAYLKNEAWQNCANAVMNVHTE